PAGVPRVPRPPVVPRATSVKPPVLPSTVSNETRVGVVPTAQLPAVSATTATHQAAKAYDDGKSITDTLPDIKSTSLPRASHSQLAIDATIHTSGAMRQTPAGGVPAPVQLNAGGRIHQYELIRELGRGGMGMVWAARDTKLGRRVAIKLLHEAS